MSYESRFGHYSVEQKRKDLMINPLYNSEKIAKASNENIIIVHKEYFEAMNKAMLETISESIYK